MFYSGCFFWLYSLINYSSEIPTVSPDVRGAAPGLRTICVGRGRVRPLSTLVPHGSEFSRVCGRGGKGTQKADRVEKLTLQQRKLKALIKCFLLRLDTRIKNIIPNTFYQCFIFKNRWIHFFIHHCTSTQNTSTCIYGYTPHENPAGGENLHSTVKAMWKIQCQPRRRTSCIEYHARTFQGHWKQKVNYKSLP